MAEQDLMDGVREPPDARVDRLQALIDENLQRVYQNALEQEIPQRFQDLLEELRKKTALE